MEGAPGAGVPGMPQNPGAAPMGAYAPAGTSAGNNWAVYQQAQAKPGQVPPQQQQAGIPIRKVRLSISLVLSLCSHSVADSSHVMVFVACHRWSTWCCPRRCTWQLVVWCCSCPRRNDGQQTQERHDDWLGSWNCTQFCSSGEWERYDDGSICVVGSMATTTRCDACESCDGQQQYVILWKSEESLVAWQLGSCWCASVQCHACRCGEANEFCPRLRRGWCGRPHER